MPRTAIFHVRPPTPTSPCPERRASLRRRTSARFPSPRGKALSDMTLSKLVRQQGIAAVRHSGDPVVLEHLGQRRFRDRPPAPHGENEIAAVTERPHRLDGRGAWFCVAWRGSYNIHSTIAYGNGLDSTTRPACLSSRVRVINYYYSIVYATTSTALDSDGYLLVTQAGRRRRRCCPSAGGASQASGRTARGCSSSPRRCRPALQGTACRSPRS